MPQFQTTASGPREPTPDLREYLGVLRIRKWSVITVTVLVLAGALAASFRETPTYRSSAQVLVKVPATGTSTQLNPPPNLETEKGLAASEAVASIVAETEGGDPVELLRGLSVEAEIESTIMTISYEHSSPSQAQRLAQGFADAYLTYRRTETLDDLLAVSESVQKRIQRLNKDLADISEEIVDTEDATEKAALQARANSLTGQIAVLQQELSELTPPDTLRVGQVVASAGLPASPVRPNHLQNGLLGLMLGLVLGVGLAFLRERLDDRLRGKEDLELNAGVPVLAAIPAVPGWKAKDSPIVVTVSQPKSAAAEAYRSLRTSILFAMGQRDAKVIMVTSPHAGDGKTTTVANLAVVLAQAGKKVIAVSADLRRPRLQHYFDLEAPSGLTNVLSNEASPWQVLKQTEIENLQVLSSGPIPGNPAELLGSDAMGRLLGALAATSDVILVDAAPALAVSDALAMVALTDGVLLVADAEATHRGAVRHAMRQLDQVNADVIGAVLNNFDPSRASAYGDYGYSYGGYRYAEGNESSDDPKPRSLRRVIER